MFALMHMSEKIEQIMIRGLQKNFVLFSAPTDPLRCVAAAPEDLLGRGGGILHGGFDRHLHVPVQKCVRAV